MIFVKLSSKYTILIFSLIVLLAAYFWAPLFSPIVDYICKKSISNRTIEKSIINSWKYLVTLPERNLKRNLKIAIGTNTNVDLILSGVDLFRKLDIHSSHSQNHPVINSLKEFKECFKFFFQKGSAAERSLERLDDFDTVISQTNGLDQQKEIGGNAALMANNIASKFEQIDVILVGPVGPQLRRLLNKKIQIPVNHEYINDELHLIMEYGIGELFEDVKAPAANRFIVSHDINNSEMTMLSDLFNISKVHKPDIIILSGLHLIETQQESRRMEKLLMLKDHLKENKLSNNVVHLELASIGSVDYMRNILDTNIFSLINSLGLNEQELIFLAYSSQTAPHANYYKELKGQPEIKKIIDILEWVLNSFGKSDQSNNSKLTRIHFHCLTFHVLAIINSGEWSNTRQALVAGTKIASKQAAGLDFNNEKNEQNLEELIELKIKSETNENNEEVLLEIEEKKFFKLNASHPVIEFSRGSIDFFLTPVLVCKNPKKTVGLGDSISSVGLVFSLYDEN